MTTKLLSKSALAFLLALTLAAPLFAKEPFAALAGKGDVARLLAEVSDNTDVSMIVGDFKVVDLNSDGRPELVATVDYTGRNYFNTIAIVWQTRSGLRMRTIETWNVETLEGALRDLDGDGKLEILVPKLLTPYLGARPYAAWTSVQALIGNDYADQSSRFRLFYEKTVIPALQQQLEEARAAGEKHNAEVAEVALFKVMRVTGDAKAGLQRGLAWSEDADPLARIYAVSVLSEIDDRDALQAINKLAEDPDPEVASVARTARERLSPRNRM